MREEILVKEQMKTISLLQDKIKLLQFDILDNLKKIKELKNVMLRRKKNNSKAIKMLMEMKTKNDFSKIDYVLFIMKNSYSKEKIDYEDN